jgi:hypothetical protein
MCSRSPIRQRRRALDPCRAIAPLIVMLISTGYGCAAPTDPLQFRLQQVPLASAGDESSCIDNAANQLKEQLPARYTLRMSALRRPAQQSSTSQAQLRDWELGCDLLLSNDAAAATTEFQIPQDVTSLRIEAFDQDERLAFSGQSNSVELMSASSQTVYLHQTGGGSCLRLGTWGGAFHSATLLPNGQVLLLGGVTGESGRPAIVNGRLFSQSTAGIFDPSDLSYREVCTVEDPIPARAFHKAVPLPSPPQGPYRVLLLGGMTAPSGTAVAEEQVDLSRPFRITPTEDSEAAEAGIVTIAFEGSNCGEAGTPQATYAPVASLAEVRGFYPALTLVDGGRSALFAGGARRYNPSGATKGFDVDPSGEPPAETEPQRAFVIALQGEPNVQQEISLRRVRVGHSSARIAKDRVVLLGGVMDGDSAELVSEYAEEARASTPEAAPLDLGSLAAQTAWQTLSEIGLTDAERATDEPPQALLLFGGLGLDAGSSGFFRFAFESKTAPVQLLTLGPDIGVSAYSPTAEGPELRAETGYHQATVLADGSVLVSGGNYNAEGCAAADGLALKQCAIDQLALFELHEGQLRQRSDIADNLALAFPRYGHQATRLLDNTVLITGGLQVDPANTNRTRLVHLSRALQPLHRQTRGGLFPQRFDRKPQQWLS